MSISCKKTDYVNVFQGNSVVKTEPREGGIPGNSDSGGLSGCYVWNTMGVFPVSGQDVMLIGTPHFEQVTLRLASGKRFVINRRGAGIYVKQAALDGAPLNTLRFSVRRMMEGGTLELTMTTAAEEDQKF